MKEGKFVKRFCYGQGKPKVDLCDFILEYDFETFADELEGTGESQPYAVGFKLHGSDEWFYFYEEEPDLLIKKFVDFIMDLNFGIEKGELKTFTMTAYNGSKFDSYFIINELLSRGVTIFDDINQSGSMLKYSFWNNHGIRVNAFDLCKFLLCPLARACKSFECKNMKSEFNHSKIKTWEDVKTYKEECIKYLQCDIYGLEELMDKVTDVMYEKFQVNMVDFVSMSNLAYSLWQGMLKFNLPLPESMEHDNYFRSTNFGGRCMPFVEFFESQHFGDVFKIINDDELSKEDKMKLVQEIHLKATTVTFDYIWNGDINSMYAGVMKQYPYPCSTYRISENPKKDFEDGKMGMYTVSWKANRSILVAPFPVGNGDGDERLSWDVRDGKGNLASVDIENAIELGYTFEFGDYAIVWDETDQIFDEYIDLMYQWKLESSDPENPKPVQRGMSKNLLCSLYGKTGQRPILAND